MLLARANSLLLARATSVCCSQVLIELLQEHGVHKPRSAQMLVAAARSRRLALGLGKLSATDAECEAAEVRAQRGRGASVLRLVRVAGMAKRVGSTGRAAC